jgi:hypothetical protein
MKKIAVLILIMAFLLIGAKYPGVYKSYKDYLSLINSFTIAQSNVKGVKHINKFGRNSDVDAAEDIWDGGGLWVPPTASRTHALVSGSAQDDGSVLSTGTADSGSNTTTLYDAAADFSGDGVAKGDAVLNDTNMDHSLVVSVDDANTLTIETTHHANYNQNQSLTIGFNAGDTYRIVEPDGAATGATVIHVFGLDSNFDEAEEFVVLNGAVGVNTARTYWRIFRMHTDGADGKTTNNVGIITATAAVDGTVTAQINAANGQTLMAIYTCPNNYTCYMTDFSSSIYKSAVGALANMSLRQTKFAGQGLAGSIIEYTFGLATDGSSFVNHPFIPYKIFQEKTDIRMRAEAVSAANCDITGSFELILVKN